MKQAKDFWDKSHHKYANTDLVTKPSNFAEWALEFFPTKGRILALGAGHGFDSLFFSNKGYSVVSTDFSEAALLYIKSKIPSNFKAEIIIEQLDISQLFRYEDNSFEIIYSRLAVHYFSKKATKVSSTN